MNFIVDNIRRRDANMTDFHNTFHVRLKDYWDNITGFDVVAFDKKVIMPKPNESTRDAIERRYGSAAVKIIRRLIG